jgi:hypothetical protein
MVNLIFLGADMKTSLFGIALLFSSVAFATPTPLKTDVALKNAKFSEAIYKSLEKKLTVYRSGTHQSADQFVVIKDLITCTKSITLNRNNTPVTKYGCTLLKNGWRSMGMETYGSGNKQELTKALFDALSVKATTDEGIKFKTIQLDVPDQDGGTERNLLSCTRLSKEAEEMGLRDTCEVINGL